MAFDFCPGAHPSCMLSALVCDRVQCLRKASMGARAVENAIEADDDAHGFEEVAVRLGRGAPVRVAERAERRGGDDDRGDYLPDVGLAALAPIDVAVRFRRVGPVGRASVRVAVNARPRFGRTLA